MKIEFLDEAQYELDEAIEYYNNEAKGLGDDFKAGSAEAGAEYYLVKPVNIELLIEKMKKILED